MDEIKEQRDKIKAMLGDKQEENAALKADLNKMKPKLAQLGGLKDKLANLDAGTDLKAKKAELNEQFSLLYEKKKGISARFGELQNKREAQEGDLGTVREEKEQKQTAIRELIEKRNALRDAFNEEKRAYKVFQDEQRRIRNERIAAERAKEQ